MKAIVVSLVLAILAGCAQPGQNAAQGGSADLYARQLKNGFPYNPPGW